MHAIVSWALYSDPLSTTAARMTFSLLPSADCFPSQISPVQPLEPLISCIKCCGLSQYKHSHWTVCVHPLSQAVSSQGKLANRKQPQPYLTQNHSTGGTFSQLHHAISYFLTADSQFHKPSSHIVHTVEPLYSDPPPPPLNWTPLY